MRSDTPTPGTDTSAILHDENDARLRAMPKAERLAWALSLSAFARDLAWQGALRHTDGLGRTATVRRFLLQLYGPEAAARLPLGGLLDPHE
jgi:hypothetical protein